LPFRQNNDVLHLSGVDQEESVLVVFPDSFNADHKEILFLKETSDLIAIWEGAKLNKEQATATSGIRTVYWLSQMEKVLFPLIIEAENIYLNSNEHLRASIKLETRTDRFTKECKERFPLHNYERASKIMHIIRAEKHPIEVDLIRQACDITRKGLDRVLDFVKPGVWEYEIEAEIIHEFVRNRSRGFAYEPIIGSGLNACVLHYIDNNAQCNDGDVILMDFGAEYANYASDLTRCVPVNGKFTSRQREVYNAVLRVHNECAQMLKPGVLVTEYQVEVGKIMENELLGLNLLDSTDIKNENPNWPAYKKYFMHGTSHYMGLDVHDVGTWVKPIPANSVFTIEPGIYIQEEKLGIRLENDYLITNDGAVNLMDNIPIEAEEIENKMNR
jgi:Xaa-Pro aminopeptidase